MNYGNVCHICPKHGFDDQIAQYLGNGWTKEDVANIRGIYDSNNKEPLIPNNKYGKLTDDELIDYGQKLSAYRHVIAREHLNDMKDSTRHPADAFARLYAVMNGETKNDRINMIVYEFSEAITRRQKALEQQGIFKTREEICNGFMADGQKMDGEFSIFEEVFFTFYNKLREAQARIDFFYSRTQLDRQKSRDGGGYATTGLAKDEHIVKELKTVLNNWGALCSFARMRFRDREGIKLGNSLEYAASTNPDNFSVDGPLEESYVLDESVREAWMTRQGEVSAFSNLGTEVRRFISNIRITETSTTTGKNGKKKRKVKAVKDDLGYPRYYDPVTTHQHLAEKLRGCRTESAMLNAFAHHIKEGSTGDPILQDVGRALLEAADVPKLPVKDSNGQPIKNKDTGKIETVRKFPAGGVFTDDFHPGNPSIITQFVINLHNNMVPFIAIVRNKNGDIVIKRLNRSTNSESFADYMAQVETGAVVTDMTESMPIYNEDGTVNWANLYGVTSDILEKLPYTAKDKDSNKVTNLSQADFIFSATDIYANERESDPFWGYVPEARLKMLSFWLRSFGFNLTDTEMRFIWNNKTARKEILVGISKAAHFMQDRTGILNNKELADGLFALYTSLNRERQINKDEDKGPVSEERIEQIKDEVLGTSDTEWRKLVDDKDNEHRTISGVISSTLGKDESQPVAEAIEGICKGIDISIGTKGIERRVAWYDRKGKAASRYSDMTPSYMGDLIEDIRTFVERGDGKGLRAFLMDKWGSDEFFYNRENKKFRNMWLQELYDSVNPDNSISMNSFAATFGFSEFLGSSIDGNPVIFENFSEKQHAVAMLKAFAQSRDQNGKSQYCDYPCFILGDAGKQRFFRSKHYDEETITKGLVDAYFQELERMDNVVALKESLGKQGIAVGDMPKGYIKSEHTFSTLMFLNPDFTDPKYFRKITGLTEDSEIEIIEDDGTVNKVKLTDQVLKDPESASPKLREECIKRVINAVKRDSSVLNDVIHEYMEDSLNNFLDRLCDRGVLTKNTDGTYSDVSGSGLVKNADKRYNGDIRAFVKDFFWNTKFATIEQIQMFTVDTAFYKDVKDLQKRYKEIYAPGKGLSLQARDYKGRLYTERKDKDGIVSIKDHETAIYFKDVISSSKDRDDFHQTIENTYGENSPIANTYADKANGKGSSVTDGQGYRIIESYRAIMGMQGKWTREMEKSYDRIQELRAIARTRESKSLTADEMHEIADLMLVLQPLKPYMFTMERVNVGYEVDADGKIDKNRPKYVLIPVQHKYAEVVLIPELMPKGKLRDMAEWMTENNVDLIASDACVKVGDFGACDIEGKEGDELKQELNKAYRHELSLSDYRIQSGVPEHLNQDQLFGTQIRKLIYSAIKSDHHYQNYLRDILRKYAEGSTEELEVNIPGAGMQKLTGNNVINLYNCLIMANLFNSFEEMEAHCSSKQQISDMLMQNSIASATCTDDVLIGLSIIEKNKLDAGDFVIQLGDPTMEHDSAAAVWSVFKKGVNKQKIKGGSAVQMAPMGSTEDGGLREVCSEDHDNVLYEEVEVTFNPSYTDTEGNEVQLRFSDYCFADNENGHNIGDLLPSDQIVDKNSPEWEEYQSFTYKLVDGKYEPCAYDEDGAVVIKPKIEVEFPGILDMIAYRIPTERLYSAINCKIKRFSHPMMGGILKVPVSGTTKAGFDFDIDKLYFFMKDFSQEHLSQEDVDMAWKEIYGLDKNNAPTRKTDYPGLFEALKAAELRAVKEQEIFSEVAGIFGNSKDMSDAEAENQKEDESKKKLHRFWNSPYAIVPNTGGKTVREVFGSKSELFRKFIDEHKDKYRKPFDEYDLNKSPFRNSRTSRNNMIMGLMRQRLKDKETMRERYTPGGFVRLSDAARAMRVLLFGDRKVIADEKGKVDFKEVNRITEEIKKDKTGKKDPEPKYDYSDPSTILIYNQQNQIAAKLIGIFANQNTHHVFCSSLYKLELTEEIAFGNHPKGLKDFLHKDDEDMAADIDLNMAELLAAAVDAVKDPVLNYLNLNLVTADSAAMLIRLGYSQREIGLLFNQPIIKELCEEIANNGTSLDVAVNKIGKKYEKEAGINWSDVKYNSDYTDTQTLADNIVRNRAIKEGVSKSDAQFRHGQLQVLKLFNQIQGAASEMNRFVQATRFTAANSIDSTWGGIIAMLNRTEQFAGDYKNQSEGGSEQKLLILTKQPPEGKSIGVINTSEDSLEMSPEDYAAANYDNPLGFEQCMLDMVRKAKGLFGQFYPHFTTMYKKIRNRLSDMTKYGVLDGDTINSITRDTMVALLGTNKDSDFDGEAAINDPSLLAYDIAPYFVNKVTGRFLTNREFYTDVYPDLMKKIIYSEEFKDLRMQSEFFGRLKYDFNKKTSIKSLYMVGVGGMQNNTSNTIVSAWHDALQNTGAIEIDGNIYRIRDLAMGLFFHNFYRLGFNFHALSTMHLTPTSLKTGLKVGPKNTDTYVNFVKKVIEGRLDADEEAMDRFANFISMQYILNHLDNYKFIFVAKDTTPVGKYLIELAGTDKMGKLPKSITINLKEMENKGYSNMVILKDRAPKGYIAFKPVVVIQIGEHKEYYMVQSGSTTKFNEIPANSASITYVKVNPQGVRGQSIRYYNEQKFNKEHDSLQVEKVSLLENLHRAFFITPGGLQEEIRHARGMGMKVHTLREMRIFMEQHPELFGNVDQVNLKALQTILDESDENLMSQVEEIHTEMEEIRQRAIANGTFMKAPNGKPTKLNERQWLQVRTKAFKNWFGDWENDPQNASKVIDDQGENATYEPLVVYHHTDNPNLTEFSTDFDNYFAKDGGTKEAIFFDEEKTGTLNRKYDMQVFLNIRDLNEYNETKQQLHDRGTTYRQVVNQSAEQNNVDGGVHMKNFDDNGKQHQSIWIIHNANQVKSAMDNIGTFSNERNEIQLLKTPLGETYGWAYRGEIWIDETKLDPQVPIHEYTHIWDEAVIQTNPALWERGKRLLRDSNNKVLNSLWNEIAESDTYGKKWKAQGKTAEEIDNLIASEVHSRLTGERGGELLEKIEKSEGGKGLIGRLKRWMKDVFKHLGKTFGIWTDEALDKLTLDDFINIPLRDFLDGINPNDYLENNKNIGSDVNRIEFFTDRMSMEDLNELADRTDLPLDINLQLSQYAAITDEYSVDMAIDKGWFREALIKVEQITKQIEDGKFTFKRFLDQESQVCSEILGQSTWLVSGRSGSSSYTPERVGQERNEKSQQEKVLMDWAEAKGLVINEWFNDNGDMYNSLEEALSDSFERSKNSDGDESEIYYERNANGNISNVIKSKKLLRYENLQEFFDSIVLHNYVFSDTPYTILGYGRSKDNSLRVILQQPFVESERNATLEEIDRYMEGLGFKKTWINAAYNDFYWLSPDDRFQITDLKPDNVIKIGPNPEDCVVIDANIKLYDRTTGIEFNYENAIGLSNEEYNRQYADYTTYQQDEDDVDSEYAETIHPEFDPNEITYEDDSHAYNPHDMLTEDEWTEFYESLIEANPLFASQAKQGAFSRNSLLDLFNDTEETNQSILERIRRGLDNGSIKPMTIDENQNDIPLCM